MKTTHKVVRGLFAAVAGLVFGLNAVAEEAYDPANTNGWKLSWADEFNGTGQADTSNWGYEKGTVRNNEWQTYIEGSNNAWQENGCLVIEARKNDTVTVKNKSTTYDYTSASLITKGKRSFLYGKYVFRAKIPTFRGAWPCMWTMGVNGTWPCGGEIDIQEMYWTTVGDGKQGPTLMCNCTWKAPGGDQYNAIWQDGFNWNRYKIDTLDPLGVDNWSANFHTWVMDWDKDFIRVYMDGRKLLDMDLTKAINAGDAKTYPNETPYHYAQYILLNLPFGGDAGGQCGVDETAFPSRMLVDYVRVYRRPGTTDGLVGGISAADAAKELTEDPPSDDPTEDPPSEVDPTKPDPNGPAEIDGYVLSWADEFNDTGKPDSGNWGYETGFVRNEEAQYYTKDNATCANGVLSIVAKKERVQNPNYSGTGAWYNTREYADYTSSSLASSGKRHFLYGKYIFRARIPTSRGMWPCMWFLGTKWNWPASGEIDVQEFYWKGDTPTLLCNEFWSGNSQVTERSIASLDANGSADAWSSKFHTWVMDWDENWIRIYCDDVLLNELNLNNVENWSCEQDAMNKCPFKIPQYMLLDLPMGGTAGGAINEAALPATMEVDYVRVYRRTDRPNDGLQPIEEIDTTPGQGPDYEPTAADATPTAYEGYKMYWHDECNGTAGADSTHWTVSETDAYTAANVSCTNGLMTLKATYDTDYKFAEISTTGKHGHKYGRLEFRARLPIQTGTRTKCFLHGRKNNTYPLDGWYEIFDCEYVGGEPQIFFWGAPENSGKWITKTIRAFMESDPKWAAKFHTWRLDWTEQSLAIYIDGVLFNSDTPANLSSDGYCPFTDPDNLFDVVFNIGPSDSGADSGTPGQKMEVDWVRYYVPGEEEDPGDDDPTLDPIPDGVVTVKGFTGGYDGGENHRISVTIAEGYNFLVEYALSGNGPWSTTNPGRRDVGTTEVWYRVSADGYVPLVGSANVVVNKADNRWTTEPSIAGWTEGETPSTPAGYALFGSETLVITYSGTTAKGESVSGVSSVSDAGSYTAHFVVPDSTNWAGLSKDVNFTITAAAPAEQPNTTMQAWFAYTAATEQVVGGAWQDETEDGVKVFLPTASSKDGDLVYVDVTAKFPAVAASKLPSSVSAQGALSAADGYLYVFAASGWTKLVNATVSADAAKSYRVEFDYGSENAPRLRVWEVVDGGFLELEDADGTSWFALTANTFKCFTSLSFSGDGTIGDFIGTSENGPREVATIEIPSFTDKDGKVKGGVAMRNVGGKDVFSVTIANGQKGACYTAFVANTLSSDANDWVAVAASVTPDADGLLTLDIVRDASPSKFAKIVATAYSISAGTKLADVK